MVQTTDQSSQQWKKNLLGALEIALLMPQARTRFSDSAEAAVRSFAVPLFLFPLALLSFYIFPHPGLTDDTANAFSVLYTLRLALSWSLFLGAVYWISKEIDRKEHFHQFVTANNWATLPATVIFAPVAWLIIHGDYNIQELMPIISALVLYTYGMTAFVAAYVLRIPWELAGFIAMIAFMVNDSTYNILVWIGKAI